MYLSNECQYYIVLDACNEVTTIVTNSKTLRPGLTSNWINTLHEKFNMRGSNFESKLRPFSSSHVHSRPSSHSHQHNRAIAHRTSVAIAHRASVAIAHVRFNVRIIQKSTQIKKTVMNDHSIISQTFDYVDIFLVYIWLNTYFKTTISQFKNLFVPVQKVYKS